MVHFRKIKKQKKALDKLKGIDWICATRLEKQKAKKAKDKNTVPLSRVVINRKIV